MIEANDFTVSGETNEIVLTTLALKALLANKLIKKAKKVHKDNVNSVTDK